MTVNEIWSLYVRTCAWHYGLGVVLCGQPDTCAMCQWGRGSVGRVAASRPVTSHHLGIAGCRCSPAACR